MKLTELEPHWAQNVLMNHAGKGQSNFAPIEFVNAITFLCPHCRTQRVGVTFEPPFGPIDWLTPNQPIHDAPNCWKRESGETFETLTLSPSCDFSQSARIDFSGHWHGFIRNGEVT